MAPKLGRVLEGVGVPVPLAYSRIMRSGRTIRVVVIGTGYVGLVTGACIADVGASVVCVDVDAEKVAGLREGRLPIYEPGLSDVVDRAVSRGALTFETDLSKALPQADVVFIAVGTPPSEDGSADLTAVVAVARSIGELLSDYAVVVTKSTVPVGSAALVRSVIRGELDKRGSEVEFDVASNPEFLQEGAAVADFLKPDRIVIGADSERAQQMLGQLYRPFVLNGHPILFMDIASAELTKYAANAMLATRISFMNMIAELCEVHGADANDVRIAIGADQRIGPKFLYPGIGYGGSCFPKDVRALMVTGVESGIDVTLLQSVENINSRQRVRLVDRLDATLGGLDGKHIAVWGLAYKPNTDDVREAPALEIVLELTKRGATVAAYDPVAVEQARLQLGDLCTYSPDAYSAVDAADALILATEWSEFRSPDVSELAKRMRRKVVFDGRNVFDPYVFTEADFHYEGIGRPGAGHGVGPR